MECDNFVVWKSLICLNLLALVCDELIEFLIIYLNLQTPVIKLCEPINIVLDIPHGAVIEDV